MKSLSENVTQSTMLNNKFIKEKEYKPDLLISLFLIGHDLFNILKNHYKSYYKKNIYIINTSRDFSVKFFT